MTANQNSPASERISYGIGDAVRATGLGRTTIYRLIKDGELKSVMIGGRRLIPAHELRNLLSQGDNRCEQSQSP